MSVPLFSFKELIMASKYTRIIVTHDAKDTSFNLAPLGRAAAVNLGNYLHAVAGGIKSARFLTKYDAVNASATITFSGAPTADETVSIANITFTVKASGATGNQFNSGGATVATSASNLAAAINASADLTGKVTASAALGVVTITAVVPGLMGNGLQISESMSNTTATAFANGTDGTSYDIDLR